MLAGLTTHRLHSVPSLGHVLRHVLHTCIVSGSDAEMVLFGELLQVALSLLYFAGRVYLVS